MRKILGAENQLLADARWLMRLGRNNQHVWENMGEYLDYFVDNDRHNCHPYWQAMFALAAEIVSTSE